MQLASLQSSSVALPAFTLNVSLAQTPVPDQPAPPTQWSLWREYTNANPALDNRSNREQYWAMSDAEAATFEDALPRMEELDTVDEVTALRLAYDDLRIRAEKNSDAHLYDVQALKARDALLQTLRVEPNSHHLKRSTLDIYLTRSSAGQLGITGNGLAALEAVATELSGTFTAWLIRARLDGTEPSLSTITAAAGKLAAGKDFLYNNYRPAVKRGDEEAIQAYRRKTHDTALESLRAHPGAMENLYLARYYLEVEQRESPDERASAISELRGEINTLGRSFAAFFARDAMAEFFKVYTRDQGQAFVELIGLRAEYDAIQEQLDTMLRSGAADRTVAAWMLYRMGYSLYETNDVEEALVFLDKVKSDFSDQPKPIEETDYLLAYIEATENIDTAPLLSLKAYQTFIENHPSSE